MRVAINGFGRIGRLVLRAWLENHPNDLEIVAINDLQGLDTALHLLKHDSTHVFFAADIEKISENEFSVGNHRISYTAEKDPQKLSWNNVDVVMECTGIFKTKSLCLAHLKAGAKKVLLACPSEDFERTIIFGVNNSDLKSDDIFVSNGSCTTNCLAPVVQVLHSEFKIVKGFASTIHSYTGDQNILDAKHKDLRRARSAADNIIPTTTGAAKTIEKIFPELKGKISGTAFRVPTPDVSLIDCNFIVEKNITAEEVCEALVHWADHRFAKNILGYTREPLVSSDFIHSPFSSIVDLPLVKVIDGNMIHVISWYDNEWGFSNRMLDTAKLMGKEFI